MVSCVYFDGCFFVYMGVVMYVFKDNYCCSY